MKSLSQHVFEKLIINKDYNDGKIVPKDRIELVAEIMNRYAEDNKRVDASDIDISKIDDLTGAFSNLDDVEVIDVTGWNTSHIKCMRQMFYNCKKLKDIIGIDDFDFSSATNITHMFAFCRKLKISKRIKNWKINKKQTDTTCMLNACPTRSVYSVVV